MKSTLRKFRDSPGGSHLLAAIARPVDGLCRNLSRALRSNVRYVGGAVTYDGLEVVFPPHVGAIYSSLIYWDGTSGYEPATWRVLKFYIQRTAHFVDIGSNVGLYAVLARKLRPELPIEAYEPIPAIHQHNVDLHRANGVDASVVQCIACSDTDGEATMYLPTAAGNADEPTATLRADSWQNQQRGRAEVKVPTRRLDTLYAGKWPARPTIVKMDVEDFEASVLRGATEFLKRVQPFLVCEILPRDHGNQETVLLLRDAGYVTLAIAREGLFRFEPEDFRRRRSFTDFLCVPASAVPTGRSFVPYENMDELVFA